MFAFSSAPGYKRAIEGKRSEMAETVGFHFAAVKAALVAAFAIADADQPRFFARLEHLRRVGVMGDRPGKGVKVVYDRDQIDRLLFVVYLSRCLIEPVVSVALIEKDWVWRRQLADAEAAVDRGEASITQLFETARKRWKDPQLHICVMVQIEDFVSKQNLPKIGCFTGHPKSLEGLYTWLGEGANSASVFDLSAALNRLDEALAEAVKLPRPPPPGIAAQILDAGKVRRGEMTLKEFRGKHPGKKGK